MDSIHTYESRRKPPERSAPSRPPSLNEPRARRTAALAFPASRRTTVVTTIGAACKALNASFAATVRPPSTFSASTPRIARTGLSAPRTDIAGWTPRTFMLPEARAPAVLNAAVSPSARTRARTGSASAATVKAPAVISAAATSTGVPPARRPCGGNGDVCCGGIGGTCDAGNGCYSNGHCVTCGATGQVCRYANPLEGTRDEGSVCVLSGGSERCQ
jgi:hypothetical protein